LLFADCTYNTPGLARLGERGLQIVATRSFTSALLTLLLHRNTAAGQEGALLVGSRKSWPLLASRGLTGAAAMTLYYTSIQLLPLGAPSHVHLASPADRAR
jgi:drug/metabolite transporter (DMT)-like permease